MPSKPPVIDPQEQAVLANFGERLRLARLRRKFSLTWVAGRCGMSRTTVTKAEHGDPSVTLGTYFRILSVLGLQNDIEKIASEDALGRRLQDLALVKQS